MRWTYTDIDDTLVLWHKPKVKAPKIRVKDPSSGVVYTLWIHVRHVKLLRLIHSHGDMIVAWSAAGQEWAKAVVAALGLADIVYDCLQKPDTLLDDEEPKYWMTMYPRWKEPK